MDYTGFGWSQISNSTEKQNPDVSFVIDQKQCQQKKEILNGFYVSCHNAQKLIYI